MPVEPPRSPLISFIQDRHKLYYGKICELREVAEGWLSYVQNTFPHFTRHSIQHSDEIVLQISNLLFRDAIPSEPIVQLSGVEAYILVASAYLHDAGMVTSDKEKMEILDSREWREWTSGTGGGAKRWNEIQQFKARTDVADQPTRIFLADVETRHLVSEFVRARHHIRAGRLIELHQEQLGRFAFGDQILQRAIADVCVGHGLRHHELEDSDRFPDLRDIRGEKANIRFTAILLRLGDLLDMSVERACPLLLNAASPLPPDSLAHWTQYRRLMHRSISPDRIEITAECDTQDEHRVLQDWCQWIVEEVKNAKLTMPKARRHGNWMIPDAAMSGADPTIKIRPSKEATYVPSDWTLKFDETAIFELLVGDLYENPLTFIRELIQNALDATRCKMYSDLIREGQERPDYPTQVNEEYRTHYPVKITLRVAEVLNRLSKEMENRHVLEIEDFGIGMDEEIIEKYFLQIGRSYYTSEDFRRKFPFIPTSRFGIGFLSVFAASEQVLVETNKPDSENYDGPIRLQLTGPRNYLLRERGDRDRPGTRIQVHLRELMKPNELTDLVSGWCKRVEFPLILNDLGTETTITAERPEMFTYEQPVVTNENAKFAVRAFPVNRPGIEGELYVFAAIDERGESWGTWGWAKYDYPQQHPLAAEPKFPANLICLHGISINEKQGTGTTAVRLDYRNNKLNPTLSRSSTKAWASARGFSDPEIESRWAEILKEHLTTSKWGTSEDSWWYKQILAGQLPLPHFWAEEPGTIRVYKGSTPQLLSLNDLLLINTITVAMNPGDEYTPESQRGSEKAPAMPEWDGIVPGISHKDFPYISSQHRKAIFRNRYVSRVRWLPSRHLAVDWTLHRGEQEWFYREDLLYPIILAELPYSKTIGGSIHYVTEYGSETSLINQNNAFVQWVIKVKDACLQNQHSLAKEQLHQLISKLHNVLLYRGEEYWLKHLLHYVSNWREIPGLPAALYPPDTELKKEMFVLMPKNE
jgi:molecular chaperone HtpG